VFFLLSLLDVDISTKVLCLQKFQQKLHYTATSNTGHGDEQHNVACLWELNLACNTADTATDPTYNSLVYDAYNRACYTVRRSITPTPSQSCLSV
jgi:hypothetical protein